MGAAHAVTNALIAIADATEAAVAAAMTGAAAEETYAAADAGTATGAAVTALSAITAGAVSASVFSVSEAEVAVRLFMLIPIRNIPGQQSRDNSSCGYRQNSYHGSAGMFLFIGGCLGLRQPPTQFQI